MGFVLLFNAHCVTHTDAHTHKKSTAEGLYNYTILYIVLHLYAFNETLN